MDNDEPKKEYKIIRNRGECLLCHDIIESKSVHDFVECSCGEVAVDGGHEYLKRSAKDFNNFKELSISEEIKTDESIQTGQGQ